MLENVGKDITSIEGKKNEVISGDGYAEEVDMMATQVFVPISKQPETIVIGPITTTEESSLSGKENIANPDFSLEQTQVFAPVKGKINTYMFIMYITNCFAFCRRKFCREKLHF